MEKSTIDHPWIKSFWHPWVQVVLSTCPSASESGSTISFSGSSRKWRPLWHEIMIWAHHSCNQSIQQESFLRLCLFFDMKMEKIRPIIKEQKNNARNTERIYHNIPSLPQQNFWSFSSQQNWRLHGRLFSHLQNHTSRYIHFLYVKNWLSRQLILM